MDAVMMQYRDNKSLGTVSHCIMPFEYGANWDDKTDKIIFGFFIFTHETVMHCFQRVKRDFGQVV